MVDTLNDVLRMGIYFQGDKKVIANEATVYEGDDEWGFGELGYEWADYDLKYVYVDDGKMVFEVESEDRRYA